jgi:ketosteroid isomerase-like protein
MIAPRIGAASINGGSRTMTRRAESRRLAPLLFAAAALTLAAAAPALAQNAASPAAEEVRQTFREYDAALQRGDAEAAARFWADEYTFVNPAGERLTKAQRLANLTSRRTAFDAIQPQVQQERLLVFGDAAVYQTVMRLAGKYSGQSHDGRYQTLVVLVKRDGRWLQVASQLTPITAEEKQEDPGEMTRQTTWTGCLQAASAGFTYRLNLDPGTAFAGPNDPASLGTPFVQLIGDTAANANLRRLAGKRVRVTGRQLSFEEAERQAAGRPDQQEAAETAAGTGGRPQRHLRYLRVESVTEIPGGCR